MANNKLRNLWEQRIADQENSGKTIRDWCRDNSIKEGRFYCWRRKLQEESLVSKEPQKWLPLEIEKTKSSPSPTITVTIGVAKIEIPQNFNRDQLSQIIQVLKNI